MASGYYQPCPELTECDRLIARYFLQGDYVPCFEGHLRLAEKGYPLAECQVGYFYHEGLGTARDLEQAFFWTRRAALHGDRDAQYNLATWFYLPGIVVPQDPSAAREWLLRAAKQDSEHALEACARLGIPAPDKKREEDKP